MKHDHMPYSSEYARFNRKLKNCDVSKKEIEEKSIYHTGLKYRLALLESNKRKIAQATEDNKILRQEIKELKIKIKKGK